MAIRHGVADFQNVNKMRALLELQCTEYTLVQMSLNILIFEMKTFVLLLTYTIGFWRINFLMLFHVSGLILFWRTFEIVVTILTI